MVSVNKRTRIKCISFAVIFQITFNWWVKLKEITSRAHLRWQSMTFVQVTFPTERYFLATAGSEGSEKEYKSMIEIRNFLSSLKSFWRNKGRRWIGRKSVFFEVQIRKRVFQGQNQKPQQWPKHICQTSNFLCTKYIFFLFPFCWVLFSLS